MIDLDSGRINQKLRTREALVEAAVTFMQAGKPFSVADVADVARVSPATAYRYFPRQELLVAQASMKLVGVSAVQAIDEALERLTDPAERLDAVIVESHASLAAHPAEYRAMLRASLDPTRTPEGVPRRLKGRRQWLSDALSGIRGRLDAKSYSRLLAAISLFVGVEGDVVLHDVWMLNAGSAKDVKRWAARTLLAGALREMSRSAARR